MSAPGSDGDLGALGWDDEWARAAVAADRPGSRPGRVQRVDMGWVAVLGGEGAERAEQGAERAATGDWVLVEHGEVTAVLPRRSAFVRGDSLEGVARRPQVVAANADVVLVVHALPGGPNPRRLERELVLAYQSGAEPVVVCTKADLVSREETARAVEVAAAAAPGVRVLVTNAVTGAGVDAVAELARPHRTLVCVGASGVGKSTLVNALVGRPVLETGEIRQSDQRGRHTTTRRELVLLPGGGACIDTPGLRAVALWDADEGLERVFADIGNLAVDCRFSDCAHGSEPGCAVRAAVEAGQCDEARVDHLRRLTAELDERANRRRR